MSTSSERKHIVCFGRALLLASLLALQLTAPGIAAREGSEVATAAKSAAKTRRVVGARNLRARAAHAARERAAGRAIESSEANNAEVSQIIQKLEASPSHAFTGTGPPLGLAAFSDTDPAKEKTIDYILPSDRGTQKFTASKDDHKWLNWLSDHGLTPEKTASKASFHPEEWLPGAVIDGSLSDTSWIPKESHGVFLDYPPDGTDHAVVRPLDDRA